ncbi:hypothetical protein Lal_00042613 [Lupinus albus]|nr:hypothetical protein Lal_00042613 [Lupinus albus]
MKGKVKLYMSSKNLSETLALGAYERIPLSSDPCLSEIFSLERERFTWEGEILGYTGGFLPERELSRLGEKCYFGAVATVRFSL